MSEEQTEKLPEKLEGGEWTRPLFNEEQERLGPPIWWEVTTPTEVCDIHTYGYAATQELSVLFAAAPRMLKALQICVMVLDDYLRAPYRYGTADVYRLLEPVRQTCKVGIAASVCRKESDSIKATIAKAKEVVEEIAATAAAVSPPLSLKPFTLIGVYPDSMQRYVNHCMAVNAEDAVQWLRETYPLHRVAIVSIAEGHLEDLMLGDCAAYPDGTLAGSIRFKGKL